MIEYPLVPKEDKVIRLINYLLEFRYDLISKNQLSKQYICSRKFNTNSSSNGVKGNKRGYSTMNKSSSNKIHKKSKENNAE